VTGNSLGEAPVANTADTEEALRAAEAGFKAWRTTPAFTRADTLHAIANEMTRRADEAERIICAPRLQSHRQQGLLT
jgi:succinate-semialdehyde dehydrogenase/glutarate-semialdehyde dehydrogenase